MGGRGLHRGFFRFRSQAAPDEQPVVPRPFWVARAVPNTDLSEEELIETVLAISANTHGALDLATARDLPMDSYLTVVDKYNELVRRRGEGAG